MPPGKARVMVDSHPSGQVVAGSYYMGKRAYTKELARIRTLNDERKVANTQVHEHNVRVKEAMAEYNRAIAQWSEESVGRGVVVVDSR